MKRYCLFACLFLFTILSVNAKPIDRNTAEKRAKEFMGKRCGTSASLALLPSKRYVPGASVSTDEDRPYYVFNVGNKQGFVIIAGDDAAEPVLGYADKGEIDLSDIPANMAEWLKLNEIYVRNCAKKDAAKASQNEERGIITSIVPPLLGDINWGQDYPFNQNCPTYTSGGQTKHYYTGCVVTAATQIMDYYKYPQQGTGSKSYVFNGQTLTADFGNTVYNWDAMLPSYPESGATAEQISAVATLAAHFGIAVEMSYAQDGSGAYTMLVPAALRDYFGYDAATTMRKRNYFSSDEWLKMIQTELDAGRPVYYGATSDSGSGGHAFVCDGYGSDGFVHINWGWYGRSNGYFLVNHLDPSSLGEGGGTGGYNTDQEIITGIRPSTGAPADFERPLYGSVKLSYTDYGDRFSLMTFISNYDVLPFDGQIAAVVTRDGEVLKALKTEGDATHIDGFANGKTGFYTLLMRDITKTAGTDVADGDCEVRLAFRETASAPWQIIRHEIGTAGCIKATVSGGKLTMYPDEKPHPDVTVLTPVEPDGSVYAKGSAYFNLTLKNNAPDFNLSDVTVRFRSSADAGKFWDYENPVKIYNGSTETVGLSVNFDESMPEGDYDIILFQKGYSEYPFAQLSAQPAHITVLPALTTPLLRQSEKIVWQTAAGSTDVVQGDNLYIVLGARNYGTEGTVGVITWLEDVNNPERTYMFMKSNVTVKKGEATTVQFYRKLPVDPGIYKVKVTYLTADGTEKADENDGKYENTITVGQNTTDILLDAVSLEMPDEMNTTDKVACKLTLRTEQAFSGTVYVRLRQYTLTAGEIATMNSVSIGAGETKTISFNYKPGVAPERYIVLVEARKGSTYGTIGQYANCYKLITVTDGSSGITDVEGNGTDGSPVTIVCKDGKIDIDAASGVHISRVDLVSANGAVVRSLDGHNLTSMSFVPNVSTGIYLVRVVTDKGTKVAKIFL